MSLIEKIDAEIERVSRIPIFNDCTDTDEIFDEGKKSGWYEEAVRIKEIILSEQKEPCHGCKHKGKTIDQYPCNMCPRIYTDKFTPINQPQEGE